MPESKTWKQAIQLLIIDDHMMIRDGLKVMLESLQKDMIFKVSEAESGEEAIIKIGRQNLQLVIIDYQMPGLSGAETIERILRCRPGMKILALSNYDELPYIQSMMEAGAKGFILKNIEPAEMMRAIRTVLAGEVYYCSQVAVKLIDSSSEKKVQPILGKDVLTEREIQILKMIAMEMTNDEIAQKIFVAKRTVDTHRQNLLSKLHVKNTAGLVKVALRMNLVEVK